MSFTLGAPVAGTDSELTVKVASSTEFGSGILIDSTHVLTAAHVLLGATSIDVTFMQGTASAHTVSESISSAHVQYIQGSYPGISIANIPHDIALITLSSPVSVSAGVLLGLGARVDGDGLDGKYIASYGFPTESANNNHVTAGVMSFTDGVVGSTDNGGVLGSILPVPGTQQYSGQSGAGVIVTDSAVPLEYVTGVLNFRDANATDPWAGGGTYLLPSSLKKIMDAIHTDEPTADASTLPANYIFGSDNQGETLEGSWRRDDIIGGSQNDTLIGHEANDTLDGGGGRDVLDYGTAFAPNATGVGLHIDFVTDPGVPTSPNAFLISSDGSSSTDLVQNVEEIRGSSTADTITLANPATHAGEANVQLINAGGGLDVADFTAVTSPITATLTWDSGGTPTFAATSFPVLKSVEQLTLTGGADTVTVQGHAQDFGWISPVTIDGAGGNDTFDVTLGVGVAPVVLHGGAGGDVFNIDVDPTHNAGIQGPPAEPDVTPAATDMSSEPSLIVIDGGAGNDTINVMSSGAGVPNLVIAHISDTSELSQLDFNKVAANLPNDHPGAPTIVVVNPDATDVFELDGHQATGVDITFTVAIDDSGPYAADDFTDGYLTDYPAGSGSAYVPENFTEDFFQTVAVEETSTDGLSYWQATSDNPAFANYLVISGVAVYGLQSGDMGLTVTEPASIPDTIYTQTRWHLPEPSAPAGWADYYSNYYGGEQFTGGDVEGIYGGSLGLSADDMDAIAIDPILANFEKTVSTSASPNGVAPPDGPTFDLDSSMFASAGSGDVVGSDTDDTIAVSSGAQNYSGGSGDDVYNVDFTGSASNLYRVFEVEGGGDDRINLPSVFTTNDVSVERFNGSDGVTLSTSSGGVTYQVYLQNEFGPGDSGVEQIGFASSDVWTKSDLVNAFLSQATDGSRNTVYGFAGDDTMPNGSGDDALLGGQGSDHYSYAAGDGYDSIYEFSGGGSDTLTFGAGLTIADLQITQFGGVYTVSFDGTDGYVRLSGEADGGDAGVEQFSFADSTLWSKSDLFSFYLAHAGTEFNDEIRGSSANDTIQGNEGDDTILGGAGDDIIKYNLGDGSDQVVENAGEGSDTLVLGPGLTPATTQVLHLGFGDDDLTLMFSDGGQVLLANQVSGGGAGVESVTFSDSTVWSGTDILNAAESFLASGASSSDQLIGFAGPDSINGGDGDDYIEALGGADTITGGLGMDGFAVTDPSDSFPSAPDLITDFTQGDDYLDFGWIDADPSEPDVQPFTFIGTNAFTHTAGELRFDHPDGTTTLVEGDIDGDGAADFKILLAGQMTMTAADFVL